MISDYFFEGEIKKLYFEKKKEKKEIPVVLKRRDSLNSFNILVDNFEREKKEEKKTKKKRE